MILLDAAYSQKLTIHCIIKPFRVAALNAFKSLANLFYMQAFVLQTDMLNPGQYNMF